MHKVISAVVAISLFVSWPSSGLASQHANGQEDDATSTKKISRAIELAHADFLVHLSSMRNGRGDPNLLRFLSNVDNYEILIQNKGGDYLITFYPKEDVELSIRGGGGKYLIDKDSLEIKIFDPNE